MTSLLILSIAQISFLLFLAINLNNNNKNSECKTRIGQRTEEMIQSPKQPYRHILFVFHLLSIGIYF